MEQGEVSGEMKPASVALRILLLATLIVSSIPPLGHVTVWATVLQTHQQPILIDGDRAFTAANGVVRGSGTLLNPYIIEGWNITGFTGLPAIEIRNTTSYFIIQNVYLKSDQYGIYLHNVTNGLVQNSTLVSNRYGVRLFLDRFTDVFNNNFISNSVQADDNNGTENSWDNGYYGGGNYWSDYQGIDNCSGLNQKICPSPDGIGDTPYRIPGNSNGGDYWPLMKPYLQDTTPPTWPAGNTLIPSHITPTSLTLTWTIATDDTGVIAYRLSQGGVFIANVTGNIHAYNVTGLRPATTYTFKVEAGDRTSNLSNDGPSVTVTTPNQPFWLFTSEFWIQHWYLIIAAAGGIAIATTGLVLVRRRKPGTLQPNLQYQGEKPSTPPNSHATVLEKKVVPYRQKVHLQ